MRQRGCAANALYPDVLNAAMSGAMSFAATIMLAVNDSSIPSPAR